jgi:pyruvate ferredoxin oxidoreductase gamma subunit
MTLSKFYKGMGYVYFFKGFLVSKVIEIRVHGRGGQGAKTAGQLIAEAALDKGKYVQTFPEYGPERKGAPMKTYVRISNEPIKTCAPVTKPNIVIVIDPTLIGYVDVTSGIDKDGTLIVNSNKDPEHIREETGFKGQINTVDATGISIKHLGIDIPNTPMLGALIKITRIIEIEVLITKVKQMFLAKIGEEKTNANISAIKEAYEKVKE